MLRNLGDLDRELGNLEDAERNYRAAMEIFQQLGDQQWLAATLIGLGNTFHIEGRAQDAVECFLRCIPIFEAGENVWWRAVALVEVGNAYGLLGRKAEAEQYLNNGLIVFRELGDDRRSALTQLGLGRLWAEHDIKKSLAVLDGCLKTFRAAGDQLCVARTLDAIGHAYAANGQQRKAEETWEESAEMLEQLAAAP